MKQDYPKMIYHLVYGHKVVLNETELEEYKSNGWLSDHVEYLRLSTIDNKIEFHKKELERLQQEKAKNHFQNLKERDKIKPEDKASPLEIPEPPQQKKEAVMPKKRGRKPTKKEG